MSNPEAQATPAELNCYGCSKAELRDMANESLEVKLFGMKGYARLVTSMMSNAQEEIANGMYEQARKTLNCAKWVQTNVGMG